MAYQNLDLYILETLAGVMAKYKQKYCVVSQDKFLKLLEEFYEVKISKRTLNYHLKKLEKQGFIKREKRIKRKQNGTVYTLPTCYFLQEKGYAFIHKTMAIFGRFLQRAVGKNKEFFNKNNSRGSSSMYLNIHIDSINIGNKNNKSK